MFDAIKGPDGILIKEVLGTDGQFHLKEQGSDGKWHDAERLPMKISGKKLRLWRINLRCTQNTMAIGTGITQGTLSHYETERCNPSYYNLLKIAKYLDAPIDELLKDDTDNVVEMHPSTPRDYNVGKSDYSSRTIQPWDIWYEYDLNPWDADIVKRILRDKGERRLDYEKIKHICDERIRQIDEGEQHAGMARQTSVDIEDAQPRPDTECSTERKSV